MRARAYRPISIALILAFVVPSALVANDEEGFKPIFDGQSLEGWRPHGDDASYWRVEDGAIVGESTEDHQLGHNTFLVWDQGQVDDFELRLQFRISGSDQANSGIQFRGQQRDDGHVIGYQADIDRAGNWVGCLYDEAQRGVLATRGQQVRVDENGERAIEQIEDAAELFSHVNIDDWNDYTISARGNVITLSINGHQTVQVTDDHPDGLDLSGLLALQLAFRAADEDRVPQYPHAEVSIRGWASESRVHRGPTEPRILLARTQRGLPPAGESFE